MAKYKPGESGNLKGKPIGSKNRLPLPTKEFINEILMENRDAFRDSLQELRKKKPSDFCKYYLELVSFELPKMRAVELTGELNMIDRLTDEQAKVLSQDLTRIIIEKLYGNKLPKGMKDGS